MASEESIENLKGHVERLEKALADKDKELATASEVNDNLSLENKTLRAERLFEGAGLSAKQAELFVSRLPDDAEITDEAVQEFAAAYDLTPGKSTEGENDTSGEDSAGERNLSSMSQAGSGAGDGGAAGAGDGSMTREEWKTLNAENPAAAKEALRKGQVQLRDDNFWVQRGAVPST